MLQVLVARTGAKWQLAMIDANVNPGSWSA
jgi:hypothetical protein